jgi:hypothetical protein
MPMQRAKGLKLREIDRIRRARQGGGARPKLPTPAEFAGLITHH